MTGATADVAGTVIAIVARQARLDAGEVRPEASLKELGLDSLGLVEVIFAIEEAFDIAIPFNANAPQDSAFDTSTIAAVIGVVESLVVGQDA